MHEKGYERFGLLGNPFQALDSESVKSIELFHVEQEFDRYLRRLKQEVLDQQTKAVVGLVGDLGTGKTERLLVAASEARRLEAYTVYRQLTSDSKWIVSDLADSFRENAPFSSFTRHLSPPKWFNKLAKVPRIAKKRYDPELLGRIFAEALNANTPAFLLLNDLHAIQGADDEERFLLTLLSLVTHTKPGVLVLVGCYPSFWQRLENNNPALASRFHRVHRLDALTPREAELILAKRLAGARIVENIDPLYPFSPPVIEKMVQVADLNPRRLLVLADKLLESAAKRRIYRVDEETLDQITKSLDSKDQPIGATAEPREQDSQEERKRRASRFLRSRTNASTTGIDGRGERGHQPSTSPEAYP